VLQSGVRALGVLRKFHSTPATASTCDFGAGVRGAGKEFEYGFPEKGLLDEDSLILELNVES
jgi:hypothetical protein